MIEHTTTTDDRGRRTGARGDPGAPGRFDHGEERVRPRPNGVRRHHLAVALGLLWLLDGILQLQPFMLSRRFATQVLAPTAVGQPAWVAWPVRHAAAAVAAHAVAADLTAALVQLAIGVGLLVPSSRRAALVTSVAWAGGIWFLGEGLGGLAGGTASYLTGAPGAAVLYALVATAAWPGRRPQATARDDGAVASWFPLAWVFLWLDLGAVGLLPGNRSAGALRAQVLAVGDGAPGWLATVDHAVGSVLGALGGGAVAVLVVVPLVVALLGLGPPAWRRAAAVGGAALGLATWVVGESLGQLFSGSATDPNTGPLLVLCAVALVGVTGPGPLPIRRVDRRPVAAVA